MALQLNPETPLAPLHYGNSTTRRRDSKLICSSHDRNCNNRDPNNHELLLLPIAVPSPNPALPSIMAPSENTNPRKHRQPPFNPPRPKTNGSGVSKSKSKASASARKANIGSIFNEASKNSKARSRPKAKAPKQRPAVRDEQIEGGEEEEEEEEQDQDDDEGDAAESLLDDEAEVENDESDEGEDEENGADDSASDADMMLAEVTHHTPDDSALAPAIPIPLLHRLMHHSFKNPEETKLSTDARACVGRYIETFIREGIARCAFEVSEKVHEVGSDSALGHDDGWLEVEDLERVGGQLVLDF
jgi:hypothetical protein